ncbi:aminotransferase class III-fold pyridoxal phosphate-dependent enzyme [Desulfosporosinus sp. SB140]|uniref:aminotransferase class III-fold pyridoxal phosphate-dependent enzyme n=1 Tax=Desulfosporosinus paludis TaxID=3115649 RepID=UPI00388DAB58
MCARSLEIERKCRENFQLWQEKYEEVGDVRGIGCMMGLEFVTDKTSRNPNPQLVVKIIASAAGQGLIVENAGIYGNVIRFLCPLVVTDTSLREAWRFWSQPWRPAGRIKHFECSNSIEQNPGRLVIKPYASGRSQIRMRIRIWDRPSRFTLNSY